MAAPRLILTVTAGDHYGQEFVVTDPKQCIIGRGPDCTVRLTGGVEDSLISRHHCQLDLEGPNVRVRDLNSRNGTYVNGWLVKTAAAEVVPDKYVLKDGDELRVGPISFRVTIC
jgi:pSer/pThr/pTyr-binding forkhead associated (FHA) protein